MATKPKNPMSQPSKKGVPIAIMIAVGKPKGMLMQNKNMGKPTMKKMGRGK